MLFNNRTGFFARFSIGHRRRVATLKREQQETEYPWCVSFVASRSSKFSLKSSQGIDLGTEIK